MVSLHHKRLLLAAGIAAALVAQPVWSSGGGGGGGSGGGMPSESAPQYDPVAEYRSGISSFEAHDFKNAAISFQHVVDVAPKHAPAQYLLGASYLGLGNYKKAKRPLEAAGKLKPDLIEAQRDLAIVYAKLGEADKAKAVRDGLIARKTTCGGTCADAASLDAAIGAIDAAQGAAPPQALGLDHRIAPLASIDGTYVAAVGLINQGRYDEAIAALDGAMWSAGPHPDLLTYLGFANRKLKRYDTARGWYEMALAVDPRHLGALEYYGELKLELGDRQGALAHLQRLNSLCRFGCTQADELRRWTERSDHPAG